MLFENLDINFVGQNKPRRGIMKEITEEERRNVLTEIGERTIRDALKGGGILVFGKPSIMINWEEAEAWIKINTRDLNVPGESLRTIFLEHLKRRASEEIESYNLPEIADEERKHMLSEVGMIMVRNALQSGLLIVSSSNILINWNEADAHVKIKSNELGVDYASLRTIIVGYLKERAIEQVEKYE